MRENPEDDVTVSGKFELTITYSIEANKDLSLQEKLELMEDCEKELVVKIKMLENVKKVEV